MHNKLPKKKKNEAKGKKGAVYKINNFITLKMDFAC